MNQSVIINILLKADQTQAGAAAFNNVLKEVVKSAQAARRQIKEALNEAFGASNLKDISAQAKLLQSLANLTNAQAKQEAQQNRLNHAQTVAQGKIQLEQVKQLNKEKQRAAVAGSPASVARSVVAPSNAETAALRALVAEKNRAAAASRAQAAASTAQAAAARLAATQARSAASLNRTANATTNTNASTTNAGSGGFLDTIFGGNLAANLAAKAFSLVTQTLKEGASTVFNYSAALEHNKVAFTRLLQSAGSANVALKFTQTLTAQTGLTFEAATRRILNTGQSLSDTLPLVETLGKAILGAGKGQAELDRIALVIEQIISAQRLLGQDANQLKELGFNAYKIIGDEIGKTSAQVRVLAQEGKISSELTITSLERLINRKYATAFEDQAKSFTGSVTLIEGRLTQLFSAGTTGVFDGLSKVTRGLAVDLKNTDSAAKAVFLTLLAGAQAISQLPKDIGTSLTQGILSK
jgi:tape measure domain-containing protein